MCHYRLGHMGDKGMKVLHSWKLLSKLKKVDLDFCEDFIYGKQKRVRFLKVGKEKKIEKLDLIHNDVWGPTQVTSLGVQVTYLGCSNYYVSFIDDVIRKIWVCCINKKYDVFDTFQKWQVLVENDNSKKVKCIKSNHSGEYCSNESEG